MKIHFLHISDIHCGYDNYTVGNMRESMPDNISRFVNSKGQKIDYIFITGDLKYGKFNPDEYPPATLEFINNLQKSLCVEPCNTFIVPGNHDITRNFIRTSAINEIKKSYSSSQGKVSDEYIGALSQTIHEFQKVYCRICGRSYNANHFYLDLGSINIIHLNTALICGEDKEDGSLIIGMSILKNALEGMDIRKPAIVLAHHSFDCLTTPEQFELERFLKSKNAVLYLCGHKHVAMCSNVSVAVKNKPLWQFLCGTNMDQDPNYPNLDSTDMDVFVGMLDTENCSGYFDAYKWSIRNSHWMPDSDFSYSESKTTDGRIYYPSKTACLSSDAIERYTQYLKYSCSDIRLDGLPVDGYIGSKKFPLDELYIPIRFKKRFLSMQEELEAKFDELFGPLDDDIKDTKKTSRFDSPFQEQVFNSIILAGPGNGKTTFLKKVINFYSNSELTDSEDGFLKIRLFPIWIKCRTLNARNDFSIMSIIKELPSSAEFPPGMDLEQVFYDTVCAKLIDGEVIILVDGLDEITDSQKRSLFIEQIDIFSKQYANNRIIITSRIAGYEDYNKSGLSDFEVFQIQPFDDEDIRALCIKWHKAVVNSLEETIAYANSLADTIISHNRIKALATNPLLLTTLLLVQRRIGRLPTKRIALYEESIKVLLETWNQEGHAPMDISVALCKLAYIAFTMTVKGVQQISKDELITILYRARDDLKRRLSFDVETPEQFIKRTEQRSSLIVKVGYTEDNNGILQEIYEFQHLTFQEYLTSVAIVDKYYPNAKRTDNLVDVLSDAHGINAFDFASKKGEIVLLTAALSGWNAEDIALFLVDKMKVSTDNADEEEFSELSRLSIMLVLDEPELEMETIKELLNKSLLKPSKNVIESIDKLASTKYRSIVNDLLKNICLNWITDNPSLASLLLRSLDVNETISQEIINQMQKSFTSNAEQYSQLSKSILMYLYEHPSVNINIVHNLIETSLLTIDENKADIIIQLLETKYAGFIIEIINKNRVKWIIDENLSSALLLKLVQPDKSFIKKISQEMQDAYVKSRVKYNELSMRFLSICNVLDLSSDILIELFKVSIMSITRKKAELIIKLLHGQYSQIIKNLAEDEFINWINGTNSITSAVYILNLIEGFRKEDAIDYFTAHVDGDERSIVEALQVVDVFYWYKEMSNELPQVQCYWEFIWDCIEDTRIAVSLSALLSLSYLFISVDKQLSLTESKKIMNALCKVIKNRKLPRNLLYLYSHMPISKEVQISIDIPDFNKQTIFDILSYDFPQKMREGALISAILHKCIDLSGAEKFIKQIEFDESQKERINKFINLCYVSES